MVVQIDKPGKGYTPKKTIMNFSCRAHFVLLILISYYLIMDIVTYVNLQRITLTDQVYTGSYSIFHPMTAKLLMSDHTNHYVLVLTSEYFDIWTGFSKRFSFITPNMVSVTHLVVALIAAKYVSSENLSDRRKGVILYEVKMWLDSLDGVIYRSQHNDPVYMSHPNTLGYFVDMISDILSGVAISFGVLFYLFKTRSVNRKDHELLLPLTKSEIDETDDESSEKKENLTEPSKRTILWKCWCFGFQIFVSSASWDRRILAIENVLEVNLHDPKKTELQTVALHSFSTWFVMYLWRLFCGQSLLQIYMLVIFIDRKSVV